MNKPDSFGENEWDTVRDMKKARDAGMAFLLTGVS